MVYFISSLFFSFIGKDWNVKSYLCAIPQGVGESIGALYTFLTLTLHGGKCEIHAAALSTVISRTTQCERREKTAASAIKTPVIQVMQIHLQL